MRAKLKGEAQFRDKLAERVRDLREQHAWSQTDLAPRLRAGTTKMRVYRIEQGEVPTTLGLIEELAAAFDLKPIEFLAPILGADDAKALQEAALQRLHKEMAAVFTRMRERFFESFKRRTLVDFLGLAARAGMVMRDEELAVVGKMLSGWIEPGLQRSVEDVFHELDKENKK